MVESNFFVTCLISLLCFSLGRVAGRLEASVIYSKRINDIIAALKKVEQLASLKGEDISSIPTTEIVYRTQKILETNNE